MSPHWSVIAAYIGIGAFILALMAGDHVYYAIKKWTLRRTIRLRDAESRAKARGSGMRSI